MICSSLLKATVYDEVIQFTLVDFSQRVFRKIEKWRLLTAKKKKFLAYLKKLFNTVRWLILYFFLFYPFQAQNVLVLQIIFLNSRKHNIEVIALQQTKLFAYVPVTLF